MSAVDVLIPSALRSYTGGQQRVHARGATVADVLADLDRRFPGMRFRIVDEQDQVRTHLRIFVGGEPATLTTRVPDHAEVVIHMALSGG